MLRVWRLKSKMNKKIILSSFKKTIIGIWQFVPILVGMIGLVAFLIVSIPKEFYAKFFNGNLIWDSLVGAILGSISTGNPLVSYIVGGEFLEQGVDLVAVSAFILTWVTVGITQLPAEILIFGKKFALSRNLLSFASALLVSFLTVFTLNLI